MMRHRSRRVPAAASLIVIAGVMVGCSASPAPRSPAPDVSNAPLAPIEVARGLDAPWSVAFLSDGTPLISERDSARILELDAEGNAREVGVIDGVRHGGEGGLLGIVVDDGDFLFVYSTGPDGNRVERIALDGEPGSLALGDTETILDGIPAGRTHNGGRIAFGPDGMLYVTVGDAGDRDSAQDLSALSGKILRMTPRGGAPADNPFAGSLIYSYGHRNPQGLAWSGDGTLYATEFGQDTWDELNVIEPGGNYGWPVVEGAEGVTEFIDPVQQWMPDEASPSGMARVGDSLYIANLRGEVLRRVPLDDLSSHTDVWSGEFGRLRDAVVSPDGALWVVTNNTDGRGDPREGDDRVLSVEPMALAGAG